MSYKIIALRALQDNYIWLIQNQDSAIVIDPTLSEIVIDYLKTQQLNLEAILLTHEHADHTGGVKQLLATYSCAVIDNFMLQLEDEQTIVIRSFPMIKVILTPGHTDKHVCFLFENKHLFCGDTLFSLGCGRVFTGDYLAMYNSLAKIKKLPPSVSCYPAHEYTLRNLEFCLSIDSDYAYYTQLKLAIEEKLNSKACSLPVLLKDELAYNLFLRDDVKHLRDIVQSISKTVINDGLEYFTQLRLLRNEF